MLIYFISAASIIAAGVATYFAFKLKEERNTLKVKFDQASSYADVTAKNNLNLSSTIRSLESDLRTSEKRVAELTAIADSLSAANATMKSAPATAPAMSAKKAGRGRPAKKAAVA